MTIDKAAIEQHYASGDLYERILAAIVASGKDPDPPGRDGRPAGGARGAVGQGAETIAGIHRPPVYRSAARSETELVVTHTPRGYHVSSGADRCRPAEDPDRR